MKTINEELLGSRKQIGLLFRKLRKERKLGLKKVALLTGLKKDTILDIELNRSNYTIDSFLKYILALDLIDSFLKYMQDLELLIEKSD